METWKPVLGYEGLYEISDLGNVRRSSRGKTLDAIKIPEAKQMFKNGATLKQVATFLGTSIPTAHSIKLEKHGPEMPTIGRLKLHLGLIFMWFLALAKTENTVVKLFTVAFGNLLTAPFKVVWK